MAVLLTIIPLYLLVFLGSESKHYFGRRAFASVFNLRDFYSYTGDICGPLTLPTFTAVQVGLDLA